MSPLRRLCPLLLSSILSTGCGVAGDHKLTPVELRVSSSGECAIGDHRLNCGDVRAYIVQHYDPDDIEVRLHFDRGVKYDEIAKVLTSLQSFHIAPPGVVNYKPGV